MTVAQLRAEIETRDQFLSKLASTLSASAGELERAARAAPRLPAAVKQPLLRMVSLVRELQIVAAPDAPIRPRLRKHEMFGWLARFCEARRLTFERSAAISCRIDDDLLTTILDELLSNAMKYRRKQPVSLHAAVSGKALQISVSNRGAWVGPKARFERFQRGESRRSVQGFGIGLWLTRRLVEAHGGELSIKFDATHTHVIVTLPVVSTRHKAASDGSEHTKTSSATRRSKRGTRR
jgi:signal transduction histidine kinase